MMFFAVNARIINHSFVPIMIKQEITTEKEPEDDEIEWLALKDMAKSRIISQGKLSEVCKNCQWKCYDI